MRWKSHVRFGGRARETDRPKGPHRALVPTLRAAMKRRVIRVGCNDPPAACRSRPLKLRAARPWKRREGWEQP